MNTTVTDDPMSDLPGWPRPETPVGRMLNDAMAAYLVAVARHVHLRHTAASDVMDAQARLYRAAEDYAAHIEWPDVAGPAEPE